MIPSHTMILNLEYPVLSNILLGLLLFGGMVGMMLLGCRRGRKVMAGLQEELPGLGAIEGALFALFGLLIALRSRFRGPPTACRIGSP